MTEAVHLGSLPLAPALTIAAVAATAAAAGQIRRYARGETDLIGGAYYSVAHVALPAAAICAVLFLGIGLKLIFGVSFINQGLAGAAVPVAVLAMGASVLSVTTFLAVAHAIKK